MTDKLIIGIVVAITVGAHWWLYKWVKFKIEEGVIIKFLRESDQHIVQDSQAIYSSTQISPKRVATICSKSKAIVCSSAEKESWRLSAR